MATEIRASEFKSTCLSLLDEVFEKRTEFVVTKRGRPVARLVPIDEPHPVEGSVRVVVEDEELLFSTGEVWSLDG